MLRLKAHAENLCLMGEYNMYIYCVLPWAYSNVKFCVRWEIAKPGRYLASSFSLWRHWSQRKRGGEIAVWLRETSGNLRVKTLVSQCKWAKVKPCHEKLVVSPPSYFHSPGPNNRNIWTPRTNKYVDPFEIFLSPCKVFSFICAHS